MKGLHHLKRRLLSAGLALATLSMAWGAQAGATPFTSVYTFGDSLSDTWRLYTLTGWYPPAPYYQGRISNGPVWPEYFVPKLGMTYLPGDNYSVAGATTGYDNANDFKPFLPGPFPGLQDEVNFYLAEHQPADAEGALFIVWAGSNDFFLMSAKGITPAQLIGEGVANTVAATQKLWMAGARHILVIDVPNLGLTPDAVNAGMSESLTLLSATYNVFLGQALDQLAAAGIPTIRLSSFDVLTSMAMSPATYGFLNVTEPLLSAPPTVDPDTYLFWDGVHPTTRAHQVLADAAIQALIQHYSPRNGKATPPASVNSLNGLVNAASKKK